MLNDSEERDQADFHRLGIEELNRVAVRFGGEHCSWRDHRVVG